MGHLGELTLSGEVDRSGYKVTHMIQSSDFGCGLEMNHFLSYNQLLARYMREIGSLPDHIQNQAVPLFDMAKW